MTHPLLCCLTYFSVNVFNFLVFLSYFSAFCHISQSFLLWGLIKSPFEVTWSGEVPLIGEIMVVIFIPVFKICGVVTNLWRSSDFCAEISHNFSLKVAFTFSVLKAQVFIVTPLWMCIHTQAHKKVHAALKLWWGNYNHSVCLMLAGKCKIFVTEYFMLSWWFCLCTTQRNDPIVIQESIGSSAERGLLFWWGMWLFRCCLAALFLAEISRQLLMFQFIITCGVRPRLFVSVY